MKDLNVFVTGGVGFIGRECFVVSELYSSVPKEILLTTPTQATGSHTVLVLLEAGCRVTIIDNMDNAFPEAYKRMQQLAGDKASRMQFIQVDVV